MHVTGQCLKNRHWFLEKIIL
uniref:Uncharacterized protein n=1 Tax=Staphylococcus aureus TaxID=1280 RepID=Q7WU35_STAAU|nr:hypothetical protein VRA0024 [Staphylococcus aureus]